MKTYQYSICGLRIRLDSEYELSREERSCRFASADQISDVHVILHAVQKIPNPEGIPCKSSPEFPVWRHRDEISRCCWDRDRPNPHFLAEYDLHNPTEVRCSVRQECWLWATREPELWSGMQLTYQLLHHRGLVLHACYAGFEGAGILFVSPDGTDGLRQARLWQTHLGASVLNGTHAGVHLGAVPMACGLPCTAADGICENVSLPLKAVAVVQRAADNAVQRLTPSGAVRALRPALAVDQAVSEEWQIAQRLLQDLTEQVPVYAMKCTPDERAVEELRQAIFAQI